MSSQSPGLVPAFVDLRRFAAEVPFALGNDWLADRHPLALPDGPVAVAALRLPACAGEVPAQAADEFLIVLAGTLTLVAHGQTRQVAAGASLVVPSGVALAWRTAQPTTLVFMRVAAAQGAADALVSIDEEAHLQPSGPPLAELLLSPTPQCRNFTDYRSLDGEFVCGTWDSTPYTRRAMRYRHYELMHLLEGSVGFIDGHGNVATFSRGDVFLVRRDADCSWDSQVHVKKVYAIHRPAA